MARMHTRKKGKSGSRRPIARIPPSWVQYSKDDISGLVLKFANEGKNPAQIGQILRDEYGIPSTKVIAGKTVSQILKDASQLGKFPPDLISLIKSAVNLRKHLKENPRDLSNKRELSNTESKIRRLVRYYHEVKKLPRDWYYEPEKAALLVK
ncbi:30S ribosomal protein S15 [Candidatus Micrarchaeota archaeon]|nr:30S ribosomal protein S15 [Candidatus Micrarchaeota archaeon]